MPDVDAEGPRDHLDGPILYVLNTSSDARIFRDLTGLAACGIGTALSARVYDKIVVLSYPARGDMQELAAREWVKMLQTKIRPNGTILHLW